MKILIDGHMIGLREGGNERFTVNLYKSLKKISTGKRFEISVLTNSGPEGLLTRGVYADLHRLFLRIPEFVLKNKIDIVHSNYIGPFVKRCKTVLMVHDVSFMRYPGFYSLKDKIIFKLLFPFSLKNADAVIVPSKFSKKEFIHFYPQYGKKIHVIGEAADEVFTKTVRTPGALAILKAHTGIDGEYLLVLNSRNPKKNINTVISAFLKLGSKSGRLKLVVVGGRENIDESFLRNKNIIYTGWVSDNILNLLYNFCRVFIYYPLYEGFGLPVLEAMKCNVPVVASDIPVIREIAGDGVIYGAPGSCEDLSSAIKTLLTDANVRSRLLKRSSIILKSYNWRKTALKTLDVYEKITR